MRSKIKNKENQINLLFISIFTSFIAILIYRSGQFDYDFLWHIRLGELLLNNKDAFNHDYFSWVKDNTLPLNETAHSWLSEIIMYGLYRIVNNNIYVFGILYVGISTFIISFTLNHLFFKEASLFTILGNLLISFIHSNPRPQLLSNTLLVITLYILYVFLKKTNTKLIWILPGISLLWSNLHGGTIPIFFAFFLLFIGLSIIPSSLNLYKFQIDKKTTSKNAKNIIISFICSFFTGLLNPYHIHLYTYFFITNNEITKAYVKEWQHSTILNPHAIYLLCIIVIPLIFYKKQISLEKWILPVTCFILGGIHQRILLYGVLCSIPMLLDIYTNFQKSSKYKIKEILILCITLFIFFFCISGKSSKTLLLPEDLKDLLYEKQYIALFNTYDSGAKLIYDKIPCFIDSRADLYSEDIIKDSYALTMFRFQKIGDCEELLKKYNFDALLLDENCTGTIEYFSIHPNWSLIYNKNDYYLFEKK